MSDIELKTWDTHTGGEESHFKQILSNAWIPFGQPFTLAEFVGTEYAVAQNSKEPRQFFYLMNDGKVVASMGVLLRAGLAPKTLNLLIIMVNTHPDYRKLGLMGTLISHVIRFYEKGNLTHEDWEVTDETMEQASIFRAQFVRTYEDANIFWTLYSAVGEYYARFGFVSMSGFEPFQSSIDVDAIDSVSLELHEGETILKYGADNHLLSDEKFLPNEEYTNLDMNLSFQDQSPMMDILYKAQVYCQKFNDKLPIPEIGFEIVSKEKTTRIFAGPDIGFDSLCIYRVVSDVDAKATLLDHLRRGMEYVKSHYAKLLMNLPAYHKNLKTIKIKTTKGDFILTGQIQFDDITEAELQNLGLERDTYTTLLPMAKSYGFDGVPEGAQMLFNGYWAFN